MNGQLSAKLIKPDGTELPMTATRAVLLQVAKSLNARIVLLHKKGYYYSNSHGTYMEIAGMRDEHIINAILRKAKNAINNLPSNDVNSVKALINADYFGEFGDGEFAELVLALNERHPGLLS